MRKQLLLLIVVTVLVILAIFQPEGGNKEQTARIGYQAPGFELKGLDGSLYSLSSLGGKPVLINFWASWCGPCRVEAPDLVRFYKKYKDEFEIYAVNLTADDSLEGAISFAEEFQFNFPVLLDENGAVSKLYKIKSIPTSYFVDSKGEIIHVTTGVVSPKTLENLIQRMIEASKGEA
ncbi:TlpA family protein disulfide reductase [Paenibacillus spongiae]|uniref:TlpA family protein disulfide reductase n=1 Tax=Paenibacillus spongiae TaxID=2909671 RepID=A0ABY5SHG6_9BACL|nr:TlpA disulfide reductase family protein [Paenibacillus spongiae]UVI33442.1 TlpA family protein disulfide reductase [Paenibacillus spongiae]